MNWCPTQKKEKEILERDYLFFLRRQLTHEFDAWVELMRGNIQDYKISIYWANVAKSNR